MINKKIGNQYESIFINVLRNKGFWCHLFSYNKNGQPCDIVAIKNDIPYLIDVKHCEEEVFNFSKIQPNQITCFEYASLCGVTKTGFAIWFTCRNKWLFLPYEEVKRLKENGEKSVHYYDLEEMQYD